jgi:hypothetical protein
MIVSDDVPGPIDLLRWQVLIWLGRLAEEIRRAALVVAAEARMKAPLTRSHNHGTGGGCPT